MTRVNGIPWWAIGVFALLTAIGIAMLATAMFWPSIVR
jgi:hypothetical protein